MFDGLHPSRVVSIYNVLDLYRWTPLVEVEPTGLFPVDRPIGAGHDSQSWRWWIDTLVNLCVITFETLQVFETCKVFFNAIGVI